MSNDPPPRPRFITPTLEDEAGNRVTFVERSDGSVFIVTVPNDLDRNDFPWITEQGESE